MHFLTIVEGGNERQVTTYDATVVAFDELTGSIVVSTDDFTLDSATWIFRLTKTSKLSTNSARTAAYDIEFTFEDICHDSVLSPPQFLKTSETFDLY